MSENSPNHKSLSPAQMLDLLLDALLERQSSRTAGGLGTSAGRQAESPVGASVGAEHPSTSRPPKRALVSVAQREPSRPEALGEPPPRDEGWEPPPKLPTIHLEKALSRFLVLIAVLIIAVNVPVTRYGVSLARMMPESASLIIRDGLGLKGSGPDIYVLEGDKLRWISSLDAFEHRGLRWGDVHVVEDAFLERFEKGPAIHVLLKCPDSPHIYRLENQRKRWIKDIGTFLAEGHVWEDVRFVSCEYLRSVPDGLPIPEDAGPPPKP